MKPYRIVATDPQIDITLSAGASPARLTGGLGGWQEIERQDDLSVSDWSGQPLLRQDIAVLLDEYPTGSAERQMNTLLKLGRDPNGEERIPPVFRVWGALYFPGKAWVLPDDGLEMLEDTFETIRRRGDGDLQRQEVAIRLMEYRRPDTVRVRGRFKMGISRHRALTYTTSKGDTLIEIATHALGDWKLWKELSTKNDIADPNRPLPAGRVLRL